MKVIKLFYIFLFICTNLFANHKFNEEDLEKLELFNLSNQIRGSNYECEGYDYIKSLLKYQNNVLKAINNPEQNLKTSAFKDDYTHENSLKYFDYWGTQSIGNFRLYQKFLQEKDKNIKHFAAFLKNEVYAKNLISIFEKRAFGDIPEFKKTNTFINFIKTNNSNDIESYIIKNSPDKYELTRALQVALLNKFDIKTLKVLIKHGAQINAGYESSVFFAIDYMEGLEFLIQNQADVNYQNFFGKTPLFYAVENNDFETVEFLLKNGALVNKNLISINELDFVGNHLPYYMKTCSFIHGNKNVFMHASSYADEKILKLLIEYGAKYDAVDDLGFNALDFAINDKNEKAINFLKSLNLKQNKNIEPKLEEEIFFSEESDTNK